MVDRLKNILRSLPEARSWKLKASQAPQNINLVPRFRNLLVESSVKYGEQNGKRMVEKKTHHIT